MRDSRALAAEHQKGMAAAIREAQREAERAYREAHPEAGAISVKADLFVYTKRPKGFSSHPAIVAEWFAVSRETLRETNAATVARLRDKFSPYPVPANLLTRPLSPRALEQVGKKLAEHGKSVDLKANNTLSKIRGALRGKASTEDADASYEVQMTFAADVVVVGGIEYPDPPSFWWTPMLAFRSWRGVSDERYAPGVSGGLQAGGC